MFTKRTLKWEETRLRTVLHPCKESGLPPDLILKLSKSLYGLSESRGYWSRTRSKYLVKNLRMKWCNLEFACYSKRNSEKVIGLRDTYVDWSFQAGGVKFWKLSINTYQEFKCRTRFRDKMKFTGLEINACESGFKAHQKVYISKFRCIDYNGKFLDYRSLSKNLLCVPNSGPGHKLYGSEPYLGN